MAYGRVFTTPLKMDAMQDFRNQRGMGRSRPAAVEGPVASVNPPDDGTLSNTSTLLSDDVRMVSRSQTQPSLHNLKSGTLPVQGAHCRSTRKVGEPLDHIASTGMVYLDYNATTPIWPEVVTAMQPYLAEFGNPSSTYLFGKTTKTALESARSQVAKLINAHESEIFFCSCGTEADNWAIWGVVTKARAHMPESMPHVITSAVEHPAVLQCLRRLEAARLLEYTIVGVDESGRVNVSDVEDAIKKTTVLITIMHSNNEVGTLQPVDKIAELARSHGIVFHSDAAQSVGKVAIDVSALQLDLLTIVGHKFGAPKGIAALYIRNGTEIENLLWGGGQESGHRGGTENVLLAVALGKAAEIARIEMKDTVVHMRSMRDELQTLLCDGLPPEVVRVNGPQDPVLRLPNTLSISINGIHAAQLLHDVSDVVAASAGSACHSSASLSSVLLAMGMPHEFAVGTLRLSVGRHTTMDDVKRAANVILKAIRSSLKLHS